jgi:hypothetical protein
MKRISIITLLLIAWTLNVTAAAPPDDAALSAALIGTWDVMTGPSAAPYGEVAYTADGRLHGFNTVVVQLADGSAETARVSMQGDWTIKDRVLVITNLHSEPVGRVPSISLKRYLIQSISADEAYFKDLSDGSALYRRRKGASNAVKV